MFATNTPISRFANVEMKVFPDLLTNIIDEPFFIARFLPFFIARFRRGFLAL